MIVFDRVSKQYDDGTRALDDISFEIKQGDFISIIGHSGAGKTTLLKMIWAEEHPTRGAVYFEDRDIRSLRRYEVPFHRRRVGVVFQDYRLLPHKNAFENVAFLLQAAGQSDLEIESDVPYALDLVNLGDKHYRYPHQLSEGEQQRLAIARAIVHQPRIIVADEPTGNLDPVATREIIAILKKINDLGTTVVLTTHSPDVVNELGRRVITLQDGRIVSDEAQGKYNEVPKATFSNLPPQL